MNTQIDITGVVLTTPRLTLRPWRESDLQDFYEYARVDGVGQMAGWLPHRSVEESAAILDSFIRHKKTFALEHNGKCIGSLGVEEYNEAHHPELAALRGREIGYVLSKDFWGRGLMPEAVRAVTRWLFDEVGLDFILVGHFERNRQSRRVIEKCGFQYVKNVPYETRYGTVEDCRDYILRREDRPRHFAEDIAESNETIIRFQGDDYHYDLVVTKKDKKIISDVLALYGALIA